MVIEPNMKSILESIIGTPQTDIESFVLYLAACVMGILFLMFILSLFQLTAELFKR